MSTLTVAAIIGPILLPPAALDHEPTIQLSVREYPLAQVAGECHLPGVVACSFIIGDVCFVTLPKIGPGGVSLRDRALLRRHEYGHCNGWTKEHEQ